MNKLIKYLEVDDDVTVYVVGDIVFVHGFEGEVIQVLGDKVLVHFGGDSLHCIQEWYNIEDVKLEKDCE